jgi:hypothetical protein
MFARLLTSSLEVFLFFISLQVNTTGRITSLPFLSSPIHRNAPVPTLLDAVDAVVTQDVGGLTELRWPSGSVIIQ